MLRSLPFNILAAKSKQKISSCNQKPQANSFPKNLGKSIAHQLRKISSIGLFNSSSSKDSYDLDPIEGRMESYRKGFYKRSMDSLVEFDNVVFQGFGTHGEECDYTLRFSLTPDQLRSPDI
ncbi:hypothetical protein CONCODRAFT_79764 [Conidiobolus coronatus NRRL 28638]|uniref:Uncharacterized protein n=1 Tax=Conidiobolus coronatus (strain ATCC 28846 / CBS 209.66 / NRRL 28638) TaxID=796925 RepID=A0A137NZW3_CONC2|nr:hypothetical protein CONCODRAFT_79764 [Conidiobolus coronatus NRRL 28638]|eukprot:KXN68356.1 hypothetical protein CONCODRAFT_79764 [Conidiobolus coronatus NRRL 28638]